MVVLIIFLVILLAAAVAAACYTVSRQSLAVDPDQALIISGRWFPPKTKVVLEGRVVVLPREKIRWLSLALLHKPIKVTCETSNGDSLAISGTVGFWISRTPDDVLRAARTISSGNSLEGRVADIVTSHLRALIGQRTITEIVRSQDEVSTEICGLALRECAELGVVPRMFNFQHVQFPEYFMKYMQESGQHQQAIELAERESARFAREQAEMVHKARARRDAEMEKQRLEAEVLHHQRQLERLSELNAEAHLQQLLEAKMETAERQSQLREKELELEITRLADAQLYDKQRRADAERYAAIMRSEADAERHRLLAIARTEEDRERLSLTASENEINAQNERVMAEVEAERIRLRAAALSQNEQTLLKHMLMERLPAIMEAQGKMLPNLQKITSVGGGDNLNSLLSTMLGAGGPILGLVREMVDEVKGSAEPNTLLGGVRPAVNGAAAQEETPPMRD